MTPDGFTVPVMPPSEYHFSDERFILGPMSAPVQVLERVECSQFGAEAHLIERSSKMILEC